MAHMAQSDALKATQEITNGSVDDSEPMDICESPDTSEPPEISEQSAEELLKTFQELVKEAKQETYRLIYTNWAFPKENLHLTYRWLRGFRRLMKHKSVRLVQPSTLV